LAGYNNEIGAQTAEQLARHVNDGMHELRDCELGPSVAHDVHERAIARISFIQDDGDESVGMPASGFWQLVGPEHQAGTFLARVVRERDALHRALHAIMQWGINGPMPFELAFDARLALSGEVKATEPARSLKTPVDELVTKDG
jgi:hypothetical protein